MHQFHGELARLTAENPRFHVHYVTAREMYNLAKAAEAGWGGTVDAARDFMLVSHCSEPMIASHERGEDR